MINRKTTLADLAFIVYAALKSHHIEAVLSGGAVVSVYSLNAYESRDLDFISPNPQKEIELAMNSIGFKRRGKNFVHSGTEFTVEFPAGPLAVGNEFLGRVNETIFNGKIIKILSPTDAIKDRLAGWIYFKDPQNLEQARILYQSVGGNLAKIKKWIEAEGAPEKYKVFLETIKVKRAKNPRLDR